LKNDLDKVWKALSDPTRRSILDALRKEPLTTTDVVARFPGMSRCINSLNVVPIRLIYERWVSGYQDLWVSKLTSLKKSLETDSDPGPKR
jgi:DNA-binding transcriptional ArsR family regulator